ncbi:hypothetical protein J1N35_035999 [Gossypium stocksii]|uniref:Transmembrane protein n=1 Tax=Gossypium stocksii TaxID=47602 RepID=A0A9D3UWQ6_9ROSI|nr:hypothetical protein J1N35_035999 [Gossypium stocksii]
MEEQSPRGIMFVLSFLFWFFIHVDSAKDLSKKLLPIFIFIIFIIFALCFLSSHTPLRSPYVVCDDNVRSHRGDLPVDVDDVESYRGNVPVDVDDVESYRGDVPVYVDDVESYLGDFPVDDIESYRGDVLVDVDNVGSYRGNFPVDVDDVESVPSLSEEEMESYCSSEEIIVEKHIILVEDDIGDMDAFSSNNSDDDWEQNYPSNIDPNFNWQFL